MADTEIIICTEKGYLEAMSKLLVWTIRNFGGQFKDIPIYSYQPRKYFKISRKTIRFFEEHEVEIVDEVLNKDFSHYPLANKPLATSHRESRTKADNLIFLDSDIFFLKEPIDLIRFDGADVIIRPVDHKNIGTIHPNDDNASYWKKLYDLLDVKVERKVHATMTDEEILEYYNSGHLVTKTNNYLLNRWNENFLKVMKQDLKPDNDLFFVEQSTLSATISQMELNVKLLEDHLNYPIYSLEEANNSDNTFQKFKTLASIHYHKKFQNKERKNPIEALLNSTKNGSEINLKLTEFGVLKRSNVFTKFLWKQRKRYYRSKQIFKSK